MKVRKAEIKDAEVIARINVETWQSAYKGIIDASVLNGRKVDEKRIATWAKIIEVPERVVLVCESDGEVVGFLAAGPSRDNYGIKNEISALYVKPAAQRQGAGSALIKAYKQAVNGQSFYLYMLKDNAKAACFYEKNGGVVYEKFNRDLIICDKAYKEVCYVFDGK